MGEPVKLSFARMRKMSRRNSDMAQVIAEVRRGRPPASARSTAWWPSPRRRAAAPDPPPRRARRRWSDTRPAASPYRRCAARGFSRRAPSTPPCASRCLENGPSDHTTGSSGGAGGLENWPAHATANRSSPAARAPAPSPRPPTGPARRQLFSSNSSARCSSLIQPMTLPSSTTGNALIW